MGKVRVTSGDAAALMAITERTHLAAATVWKGSQPVGLNDAKIDMDEAVHWLVGACDHLLPESLRSCLRDSAEDKINPPAQPSELLTLKPAFMGMSINLNEFWRRACSWWKKR